MSDQRVAEGRSASPGQVSDTGRVSGRLVVFDPLRLTRSPLLARLTLASGSATLPANRGGLNGGRIRALVRRVRSVGQRTRSWQPSVGQRTPARLSSFARSVIGKFAQPPLVGGQRARSTLRRPAMDEPELVLQGAGGEAEVSSRLLAGMRGADAPGTLTAGQRIAPLSPRGAAPAARPAPKKRAQPQPAKSIAPNSRLYTRVQEISSSGARPVESSPDTSSSPDAGSLSAAGDISGPRVVQRSPVSGSLAATEEPDRPASGAGAPEQRLGRAGGDEPVQRVAAERGGQGAAEEAALAADGAGRASGAASGPRVGAAAAVETRSASGPTDRGDGRPFQRRTPSGPEPLVQRSSRGTDQSGDMNDLPDLRREPGELGLAEAGPSGSEPAVGQPGGEDLALARPLSATPGGGGDSEDMAHPAARPDSAPAQRAQTERIQRVAQKSPDVQAPAPEASVPELSPRGAASGNPEGRGREPEGAAQSGLVTPAGTAGLPLREPRIQRRPTAREAEAGQGPAAPSPLREETTAAAASGDARAPDADVHVQRSSVRDTSANSAIDTRLDERDSANAAREHVAYGRRARGRVADRIQRAVADVAVPEAVPPSPVPAQPAAGSALTSDPTMPLQQRGMAAQPGELRDDAAGSSILKRLASHLNMLLWRPVRREGPAQSTPGIRRMQRKSATPYPTSERPAQRPARRPGVIDTTLRSRVGSHLAAPALYARGPDTYIGPVPALTASGVARRFRAAGAQPAPPEAPTGPTGPAEELRAMLQRLCESPEPDLPLANVSQNAVRVSGVGVERQELPPHPQVRGGGPAQRAGLEQRDGSTDEFVRPVQDVVARRGPDGPVVVQRQAAEPVSSRAGSDVLVQRAVAVGAAATMADDDQDSGGVDGDVVELARRVYPYVKRLLRLERERLPRGGLR